MSGNAVGALRTAAKRIGVDPVEYAQRVLLKQKWCSNCRIWHPREDFPTERCRSDGLHQNCRQSRNALARQQYATRRA